VLAYLLIGLAAFFITNIIAPPAITLNPTTGPIIPSIIFIIIIIAAASSIIFASLTFLFFSYLIIDYKLKPIEALKYSAKITKGAKWKLLLLLMVFVLIAIAGFLCLGIGLLVALPLTTMILITAYRHLVKQTPELNIENTEQNVTEVENNE
jgi:uncharacterized membrane protein